MFPVEPVFTCDGEAEYDSRDPCALIQDDRDDNLDWERTTGTTPSGKRFRNINGIRYPVTGPENAVDGDYYFYLEASGMNADQVARWAIHTIT